MKWSVVYIVRMFNLHEVYSWSWWNSWGLSFSQLNADMLNFQITLASKIVHFGHTKSGISLFTECYIKHMNADYCLRMVELWRMSVKVRRRTRSHKVGHLWFTTPLHTFPTPESRSSQSRSCLACHTSPTGTLLPPSFVTTPSCFSYMAASTNTQTQYVG